MRKSGGDTGSTFPIFMIVTCVGCSRRSTPEARAASRFLCRVRPDLRRMVARWTGEYQYTIDLVLKDMIVRSRRMDLFVGAPEEQLKTEAAILLSIQTMNYLHGGRHRLAM